MVLVKIGRGHAALAAMRIVCGGVAIAVLAACDPALPPERGMFGIAMDEAGAPVALMETCGGRLDGMTLYFAAAEPNSVFVTVGHWQSEKGITGGASLTLTDPSPEWSTAVPLAALRDGGTYMLAGGPLDNSYNLEKVAFSRDDFKKLSPARALVGYKDFSARPLRIIDRSEFDRQACAHSA